LIDPNFPSAKIIAHSQAPNGDELITFEIELHRFILPEFNTHRSFSRNFQSSRAVPIEKMIEQVENDPAYPVHWGKNQAGMVAEVENNSLIFTGTAGESGYTAKEWWGECAKSAAIHARYMAKAGYHKQIVNRLLEPFMKTKGVVTATRDAYEAFFKLRCHKDAQPEIKLLAERMRDALDNSVPKQLSYGDYHLPYLTVDINEMLTEDAVKISSSCTAQVSYRRLDDSLEKALKVYDMLNLPCNGVYPEDPPHFSPTEHIARVSLIWEDEKNAMSGNFNSRVFWQYRKALEIGEEQEFLK
jgi:hypothetical protein